MNLALHPFATLTAILSGAMMLVLAPATPAQTSAHGIQTVIDGTSPVGPLHGGAQGTWLAPGLDAGHAYAKLFDTDGVERFTLNATLTQYLFLVPAPNQGEIYGELLVPHVAPGRGLTFAMIEVYAQIEGTWIETSNGRGAFTASILRSSPGPDGPLVQIGLIEGTFQLRAPVQPGRIQPTLASVPAGPVASGASGASGAGSAASAALHLAPAPSIEVLPGHIVPQAHGVQLVGDEIQRRPLNDHGGLGQVGQVGQTGQLGTGAGSGAGKATAVLASRGRLTLRWQLFE